MSELRVFNNPEFGQIRVVEIDGKPFAVARDVALALEYSNPNDAIIKHCKGVAKCDTLTNGGKQEVNVIPEGDIYRLIVKAADQSRSSTVRQKAERFERWIFDDVLPSIHKHGAYLTQETIAKVLFNPDTIILLATQLKEEQRKRTAAERQVEVLVPKGVYADAVTTSPDSILIAELAKILRQNGVVVGQNRLFTWMREQGYLGKHGSYYNQPTQRAMEMGLFEIKKTAITHGDGSIEVKATPKVTGKGQLYFVNKFLSGRTEAV